MTHVRSTFLHFIPSRQRPFLYNKNLLNNACGNDFVLTLLCWVKQPLETSSLIPFLLQTKPVCAMIQNKRTKTKLSIVSSASLIPGLLMKMKTRQPSLFLIQLNEAIVNHSLTLLLIFFFNFQSLFPVA